jgi:HKD family nuclease
VDRINLLDELRAPGYKVALFTSFSTDLLFFEKMILRDLIDRECTYIGLFLDQRCLYDAITKPNITELGKSYAVKGIETNEAFHPKVYLLLGEKQAKVIIGSGNLTPAGFITNHEVFNRFTYNETLGEMENIAEIQAAFKLFQSLYKKEDNKAWQELFAKTKEYEYLWKDADRESFLLTNQERTLQEQLDGLLPSKVKDIECFVPYFDQSLSLIDHWNEQYQPERIKLYLQNEHTNFPRDTKCSPNILLYEAQFLEDSHKRYHGKVFRFIGEDTEKIIYGSGNCSRQAFLYSFQNGGNSEAIVIEDGAKGEFDSFWEEHITLTPLPTPLPESFKTMEDFEQEELEKEEHRIQYMDGVLRDKQLFVTIKTAMELDHLLIGNEQGTLSDVKGNQSTYVFKEIKQLGSIFSLEGHVGEISISFKGWYHDPVSLHNTFHNTKSSVHNQLPDDPYLNDYHNIVALLDDLQNRLVLTENDVNDAEQNRNRLRAIHNQAELGTQDEYINDNIEDYYASEDIDHIYGSLGNVDVIGNLIRILLRGFYEESAATLEISSGDRGKPKTDTTELSKDMREQLQQRMKRFRSKFNRGINSAHYLEHIESDILIKNMTVYSGFLFLLKERLKEYFLTQSELVEECFGMVKTLIRFSENHILDTTREDMKILLIQSLATIAAKEYVIIKSEDNFMIVRNEKKALGQLLKNLHKQIYPIGKDISIFSSEVSHFLQRNFGIELDAESYEKSFVKMFPLISFILLEREISDKGLYFKEKPIVDETTILLKREFRLTPEFNLIQLKVLTDMLKVEEWEDAPSFKIRWFNTNPDLPLKRFVLFYNQKTKVLKKKYVYKQRPSLIEQKNKVYKHQLQAAVEKGDSSIIVEGFKEVGNKR